MSAGTDYHQNDPLIKSRTCQYLRHRPMVNVIDILRPQNINRHCPSFLTTERRVTIWIGKGQCAKDVQHYYRDILQRYGQIG